MYFYDRFYNPQYVNPTYFTKQQEVFQPVKQDEEILKVAKAMRDLCRAVKNMDEQHQEQAFAMCLNVIAQEYGWNLPHTL